MYIYFGYWYDRNVTSLHPTLMPRYHPPAESKDGKLSRRTSYLIATRQTQSDNDDGGSPPAMAASTNELETSDNNLWV